MRTGISVLGSGSQGNSILIHTEEFGILIDAGFSRKEILQRLEKLSFPPAGIKAVLLTHEHEDHVKGCRVFADQFDIPTYLTAETLKYLQRSNKTGARKIVFDPGTPFKIGDFHIEPFTVQHDAIQPVGFTISNGETKIAIATDLGHLTNLVKVRMAGSQAIILESNHDMQMLRDAMRPLHLKRRIMGRHGHLNNEDAVEAFEELVSEKTSHIFMAHISSECNQRELVNFLALEKLKKMRRTDILLHVLEQAEPLCTVWIDSKKGCFKENK